MTERGPRGIFPVRQELSFMKGRVAETCVSLEPVMDWFNYFIVCLNGNAVDHWLVCFGISMKSSRSIGPSRSRRFGEAVICEQRFVDWRKSRAFCERA